MNSLASGTYGIIDSHSKFLETQRFIDALVGTADGQKNSFEEDSLFASHNHTHINLDAATGGVTNDEISAARIFPKGVPVPKMYRSQNTLENSFNVDTEKLQRNIRKYAKRALVLMVDVLKKSVELFLKFDALSAHVYNEACARTSIKLEEYRIAYELRQQKRIEALHVQKLKLLEAVSANKVVVNESSTQSASSVHAVPVQTVSCTHAVPVRYTALRYELRVQGEKKTSTYKQVLAILYRELVLGAGR